MEAELLKQKEAIKAAKREHELEIARLAVASADGRPEVRERIGPRHPSFPHLSMARTTWVLIYKDLKYLQRYLNGRRQDGLRNLVLSCPDAH